MSCIWVILIAYINGRQRRCSSSCPTLPPGDAAYDKTETELSSEGTQGGVQPGVRLVHAKQLRHIVVSSLNF